MPQLALQNTHQNNAHIHRNRLQPKPATPFALCSAMLLLLGMALLASCSSERSAALSSRPVKLTARAADVLGFESAADWQGMQRTNAAHTQGAASGEVVVNGWTQISSVPLSSIASPGEVLGAEAFLDVRLP
jgi:hypothetical protein